MDRKPARERHPPADCALRSFPEPDGHRGQQLSDPRWLQNGAGKIADILPATTGATPSATSVTYAFNLAAIGNPSSFDWRIAEPAASTCQTQGNPEPNPRDVLPDSGLATYAAAGPGSSCDDAEAKLETAKKKVKKAKRSLKQAKQNGTDAQVEKAKKKLEKAKKKVKKAKSAVEAACG